MLIDLNRCTGCGACVVACKKEYDLPPTLDSRPGTKGFSFIKVACIGPEGEYPELWMYHMPILCMHCENPPCLDSCPTEAIYRQADGLVLIDGQKCTACETCIETCPYDAVSLDSEQGVARKCTLCAHRRHRGQRPACAAACNAGAIVCGNITDPGSEISTAVKEGAGRCFVLKPELETGPTIRYRLDCRSKAAINAG